MKRTISVILLCGVIGMSPHAQLHAQPPAGQTCASMLSEIQLLTLNCLLEGDALESLWAQEAMLRCRILVGRALLLWQTPPPGSSTPDMLGPLRAEIAALEAQLASLLIIIAAAESDLTDMLDALDALRAAYTAAGC